MSNKLADQIGFWAALLATVFLASFAIVFTVTAVAFPGAVEWHGLAAYAASYNATLMFLLMFPVFLLAPTLLVMMACIHDTTPQDKKILSLLALVFTTVYAVQISYNYYTQMTAVTPSLLSGELEGLAIYAFFNPRSIPLNLELLGYGMLSVGMIFAAFLFRGGRTNTAIFWLFLINGVLNALYVFEPFVRIGGPPIVLMLFNYTVPIATALIAVPFRRAQRRA
ncbi:MAG: hypothetical protein M5U01_37780 [Ardenticatenaceae bacterium]|nr:hypothetical protein [Ardenticatenaceae bacterium]HBY96746.1 hypothetical protein [Chloroflexota bacterium]